MIAKYRSSLGELKNLIVSRNGFVVLYRVFGLECCIVSGNSISPDPEPFALRIYEDLTWNIFAKFERKGGKCSFSELHIE